MRTRQKRVASLFCQSQICCRCFGKQRHWLSKVWSCVLLNCPVVLTVWALGRVVAVSLPYRKVNRDTSSSFPPLTLSSLRKWTLILPYNRNYEMYIYMHCIPVLHDSNSMSHFLFLDVFYTVYIPEVLGWHNILHVSLQGCVSCSFVDSVDTEKIDSRKVYRRDIMYTCITNSTELLSMTTWKLYP